MVLSSTTKKSFEKNLACDLFGEFFGSLQSVAPVLIFLTIGSTGVIEFVDLISACIQRR